MHLSASRVKPTSIALLAAIWVSWSVPARAEPATADQHAADQHDADQPSQSLATANVERLVGQIVDEPRVGVAAGKAKALGRYANYMPNAVYIDRLEQAADEVRSPLVAFELLRSAEYARLANHDFSHGIDAMDGPLGEQGCLTNWQIVGPFDNPSMQGFGRRLGPESGTAGPYDGKLTEVDWRDNPDFDQMCTYDLANTVDPSTAAVVYMSTQIEVDHARGARLLMGADGAFKAWLDGKPVAYRGQDLGLAADGQAWPIELDEGTHQLLIKLGSTSDAGLGLTARLVDADLSPIADATTTAAWTPTAVDEVDADALEPTGDGLAAQAAQASRAADADADAVWAGWLWSRVEPRDAGTPWRAAGQRVLDMADAAPNAVSARQMARASALFEQHWRRLDVLQRADALADDDPWVALDLADEYGAAIASQTRQKQLDILEDLVERRPHFLPATMSLADWYANRGFNRQALKMLQDASGPNTDDISGFISRLAYLTDQAGRKHRADALYRRLETVNALNTSAAWRRCDRLIGADKHDDALALIDAQQRLAPWSLRWQLREVNVLRAAGRLDDALALVDALISERPGQVHLYRTKANVLVAMGQHERATDVVAQALDRRPQDARLRKFLAFLEPETDHYYEPWMVDDLRKFGDQHPAGSHNYDTLVDQTVVRVAPNGLANKVVQRVDRVITNEGIDRARFHKISYTNGDERVEVLGVRVIKADGSVSEDYDQWHSGGTRKGSTTYNDSAYVNLRANNVEAGDLVAFRYRVDQIANENFRGDYFGDISYMQSTVPIALSRYAVHYPASWELHFRAPAGKHRRLDNELPGQAELADGYRSTAFELDDVDDVQTDPGQPGYTEVYDYLLVSNKKTYDEVGHWWWNLIKEQLIVDDTIADKVAELTDGLSTDAQKVRAIHNYVVKNTRYLHVGLGIHGWKPYRTTSCFRNRYGDCKDKASLLKVMLDAAGVPAKMVLVRTRRMGRVDRRPASMHIFNHAITYVPQMDLFLDGTAEYNGTTELTPMDQGAQGLIVDDGGDARLVRLPVDEPTDNLLRQTIRVDLSGARPTARGRIVAHGQNAAYYRRSLEDPQRRDETFEKHLADVYPNAELISATYRNLDDLEKPVDISFEFKGGRFERARRDHSFVFPYGAPKDLLSAYAKQASRTQDLSVRLPFVNHTTMRYRLADGRAFGRVPADTHIDTKFGSATLQFERQDDELVVDISYQIAVQRVSADEYPDFRSFTADMTSALNETIGIDAVP